MRHYLAPEDMPLTEEERTLLEWLIANGTPDAHQYAHQVPRLRVIGRCTCGCPTIDLALAGDSHKKAGSKIIADFEGVTSQGLRVGVIVHVREEEISELEVYPIDEATGPFGLPSPETLRML